MGYVVPLSPAIAAQLVDEYSVRSPLGGEPEWIVTVDLGKRNDPTVVTAWRYVVRAVEGDAVLNRPDKVETSLMLCRADEYLHMDYVDVRARIRELVNSRPIAGNNRLLVDSTGVGEAVVDDMRRLDKLDVVAIKFTGGDGWHPVAGDKDTRFRRSRLSSVSYYPCYLVGKGSMVTSTISLLQQRKMVVSGTLSADAGRNRMMHEAIERQLKAFTGKVNEAGGKVKYENLTDDIHDDFVVCFLMTAWWACHFVSSFSEDADKVVVRRLKGGGSGWGYGRYRDAGERAGFDTYGGIS